MIKSQRVRVTLSLERQLKAPDILTGYEIWVAAILIKDAN